jgi:UDP-N-acetylmuramoyl-tripeptide--D-alanyl-D-alanine ligase
MGMYLPGDIAYLARVAEPRIGVVTNVAPIHLARVGSLARIARAKSELVAALPVDGLAVLNGDDPWTRAMAVSSGIAPTSLVGRAPDCDVRALEVTAHGLEGLSITVRAEGREIRLRTHVPGEHTVHAFLAAIAVARFLGLDWETIAAVAEATRVDVRQRMLRGPDGMLIIDDSYNAAPLSVAAALELLKVAPGRKIAVLGDMLELGAEEEEAHRQVGGRAAEVADWLVVRGPRSAWIAEEAERLGFPAARVRRAGTNQETVEVVRSIVAEPGDTDTNQWAVLVKGSRGMRMEEVVSGLRGES